MWFSIHEKGWTLIYYLHGRRDRAVPFFRTRHKHIRVGSGATSMSLTVLK